MSEKTHTRKVLLMRIDGIGDILLFYPFLRFYREYFVEDDLTFLVTNTATELFGKEDADTIIPFDRKRFRSSRLYRTYILWKIRASRYDLIVYPPYTHRSDGDQILKQSAASQKIFFAQGNTVDTLPNSLPIIPDPEAKHEILRNEELARKTGATVQYPLSFPEPSDKDCAYAEHLLKKTGKDAPLIALGIGAGEKEKTWPLDKFMHLAREMRTVYPSIFFVVVGGNMEKGGAEEMKKVLGEMIIDTTGSCTIIETLAVLKRCTLFVGNDSSPMHMAASMHIPVIEITPFSLDKDPNHVSSPVRFGPWETHSQIVYTPTGATIREISVEKVLESVKIILAANPLL